MTLDRHTAILQNRDPRGVQWAIFPQTGKSLFLIYAVKKNDEGKEVPDTKYKIPEECDGEWTHQYKAQEAIVRFLRRFWDESDAEVLKRVQKRREPSEDQVTTNNATD